MAARKAATFASVTIPPLYRDEANIDPMAFRRLHDLVGGGLIIPLPVGSVDNDRLKALGRGNTNVTGGGVEATR